MQSNRTEAMKWLTRVWLWRLISIGPPANGKRFFLKHRGKNLTLHLFKPVLFHLVFYSLMMVSFLFQQKEKSIPRADQTKKIRNLLKRYYFPFIKVRKLVHSKQKPKSPKGEAGRIWRRWCGKTKMDKPCFFLIRGALEPYWYWESNWSPLFLDSSMSKLWKISTRKNSHFHVKEESKHHVFLGQFTDSNLP